MATGDNAQRQGGGLLTSVRRLATTFVVILQQRFELVVLEIEEERLRLARLLTFAIIATFFLFLAGLLVTLFVVVLFWDSYRLQSIGGLALLYIAIGGAAAAALCRRATHSRLFSATLAELTKDLEKLSSK